MKLLIVDDSRKIREVLKTICSHLFDEVIECEDGDEAIKLFSTERPDWVLMDIKMRRMDGIEATLQIKTKYPEAKIIIVSQFTDENIIEASKKSGAIEFVNKEDLSVIEDIIKENF